LNNGANELVTPDQKMKKYGERATGTSSQLNPFAKEWKEEPWWMKPLRELNKRRMEADQQKPPSPQPPAPPQEQAESSSFGQGYICRPYEFSFGQSRPNEQAERQKSSSDEEDNEQCSPSKGRNSRKRKMQSMSENDARMKKMCYLLDRKIAKYERRLRQLDQIIGDIRH